MHRRTPRSPALVTALLHAGACASSLLAGSCASAPRSSASDVEVLYVLERVQRATPPQTCVEVTLRVRGAASGETDFRIAESWGGCDKLEQGIRALTIRGADGRALEPQRPAPHRWVVRHAPGEALVATYELAPSPAEIADDSRSYYRPIVRPQLFHLIGNAGLLYAEHLEHADGAASTPSNEDGPARHLEVAWRGFAEAGQPVISSFSADPAGFRVRARPADLRHALFLAGDWRLHRVDLRGRELDVAISGRDWGFTDAEFVALATRIVRSQREFFDDPGEPFYLISLLPVGKAQPGSRSLGGTGLTNSFACFMLPDTKLREPGGAFGVDRLLSHELFHNWNGRKIGRVEPEELVYWFSEGFTDFYARRLLMRAGLRTPAEYVASLNESLAEYMLNRARNEKNERIRADFWNVREVEQLPYRRGDLVALALDTELRKTSGGARSLDDFMKELLRRAVEKGEDVSTESLLALIAERTSPAFAERIRRVVVDGETIAAPPELLEPSAEQVMERRARFDAGFDEEASRTAKVVTGVVDGSAAQRAGLRNGQRLRGWSISRGDTNTPIEVTVDENGAERTIRYKGAGAEVDVPQFRLRASASSGH